MTNIHNVNICNGQYKVRPTPAIELSYKQKLLQSVTE